MSHHLSNRAWDIELKGNQKLVMLALAHLSLQSSGVSAPTVARLVFMCGISDSCVRAQLKILIKKGLVWLTEVDGKTAYKVAALLGPAIAE